MLIEIEKALVEIRCAEIEWPSIRGRTDQSWSKAMHVGLIERDGTTDVSHEPDLSKIPKFRAFTGHPVYKTQSAIPCVILVRNCLCYCE